MSTVVVPRPAIVRRPAGRIVTRAATAPARAGGAPFAPAVSDGILTVALLLFVLPLFGQTFHYMSQWPAPYYLSKAWPIIVLPLFLRGLAVEQAPIRWLFVLLLSYTVGLTPLISMIHFGNPFGEAVLTSIKIWPFIYYPAFLGLLLWLRPAGGTLRACVLGLGLATFVLMLVLWVVLPDAWYSGDGIRDKFLLYEFERGYRIYMPMFFGLLFVFYLARRFSARTEWWVAAALVACFVLMLVIYKQRTSIGAAAVVTVLAGCPPRWRRFVVAGAIAAAAIGLIALLVTPTGNWAAERFGSSLLVRLESARSLVAFVGDDVLGWAFGLGTVTRFSAVTLGDIVGNDFFFLADLGWLGVVFEYGVAGALLVAGVYVAAWRVGSRNGRLLADPFGLALGDYILFTIVTTAVYSPTFLPGEMATVLALSVYLARRAGAAGAPAVLQRSNS